MVRPIGMKIYKDRNGNPIERKKCSIDGCGSVRHFSKGKREDGSTYDIELSTCCQHRKDGKTFRCNEPDKRREQAWRAQGIHFSFQEYQRLFAFQNGRCAICGKLWQNCDRVLEVEHCHKTGNVRGLVCRQCNAMIGHLERVTTLDDLKSFLEENVYRKYPFLNDIKKRRKSL